MIQRTLSALCASMLLFSVGACGDDADPSSDTTVPDTTEPDATEPDTAEPDTAEPDTTEPDTTEPDATEPDVPPVEGCGDTPVLGPQHNDTTEACESCFEAYCCAEGLACSDDTQCSELRACYAECAEPSGSCIEDCTAAIGGSPLNGALVGCRSANCGAHCGINTCIGSVQWETPAVTEYEVDMVFRDFQTGAAVAGAALKLCDKHTDLGCDDPLIEATTDAEGAVTLTVPSADDGISVFIALDAEGYRGSDFWYVAPDPVTLLEAGSMSWNVVSNSTANLMALLLGVTYDETRGVVSFIANDCVRAGVGGLAVEADTADGETTRFFIEGSVPNAALPTSRGGGAGAFLNLPTGEAELTVIGPGDVVWGKSRVNVRAGRVVGTNVGPTPLDD